MTYEAEFDVVIEGSGSERGARVVAASDGLYVNQHEVPYQTLLGVALRGSILLVFGTQMAMALRGTKDDLATLAAELRRHADLDHLTAVDREELEGERVVFSTPVAASGEVDGQRMKGMALAVVTDSALHVLERAGQHIRLSWDTIENVELTEARFGRLMRLRAGTIALELLYLTEAQIQTIRGLVGRHSAGALASGSPTAPPPTRPADREAPAEQAAREPPGAGEVPGAEKPPAEEVPTPRDAARPSGPPPGPPEGPAPTLDMPESEDRPRPDTAARASAGPGHESASGASGQAEGAVAQVDPARHFTVPEFERSLGSAGAGADRPLAAVIDKLQMSPALPVGFLEDHLQELRTLYEGVLLRRKREAGVADDLFGAAAALGGERMWEDLTECVGVMVDAIVRAFERQARRLAANRRMPWRKARKKYMPSEREVTGLEQRLMRGISPLESAMGRVSVAASELSAARTDGEVGVEAAYERWLETLAELDETYAEGWNRLGREIAGVWQDALLPRLTRLAGERRRLLPTSVRVALYFLLAVALAAAAYLYFTGRLVLENGPPS